MIRLAPLLLLLGISAAAQTPPAYPERVRFVIDSYAHHALPY